VRAGLGRAGIFLVSSVLALTAVELVTGLLLPSGYYVWPPGLTRTFRPDPEAVHGVRVPSRLTINAAGMRGDPPGEQYAYRILAVGGSTTICVYLDDEQAWPYQVQQRLNNALGADTAWVGNVGRPGHTTGQHVLQVEKLLETHPEIDAVVLMVGFNDMSIHLSFATYPPKELLRLNSDPQRELRRAFSIHPDSEADLPWYARNAFGRLWRLAVWEPLESGGDVPVMDEKGAFVSSLRERRRQATSFRAELPDLSSGLSAYVRNLDRIIDLAHEADVRVILVTQPTLWREGLSDYELSRLWAGGPPFDRPKGSVYYTPEALAEAVELYNEALLGLCEERGVECLDAATQVPRTSVMFYDDTHLTEAGASRLADLLANHLLTRQPLR
jgi:lysophospholipase L1-like esterase